MPGMPEARAEAETASAAISAMPRDSFLMWSP
jgi:hypothetical protein